MAIISDTTICKDVKIGDTYELPKSPYGQYVYNEITGIRETKARIFFSIKRLYVNVDGIETWQEYDCTRGKKQTSPYFG